MIIAQEFGIRSTCLCTLQDVALVASFCGLTGYPTKCQGTAALQDVLRGSKRVLNPTGFGVRSSSTAFLRSHTFRVPRIRKCLAPPYELTQSKPLTKLNRARSSRTLSVPITPFV